MAYVPQYHHDVFISYAHLDELNGWVSEFEAELRAQLGQALGEAASIWFDSERLKPGFVLSDTIRYDLSRTAILLRLQSPSYLQSPYCAQELRWFGSPEKPLDEMVIGSRSRVVPLWIRIQPGVPGPNVLEEEFHEGGLPLDPAGTAFRERVALLAQVLAETLRLMETQRTPVYIPYPGVLDVEAASVWNAILGELKAHNYRRTPRLIGLPESDTQTLDELGRSPISIHLVGVPCSAATMRRIDLARRSGKPVLVWISPQARAGATVEQAEYFKSLSGGVDLLEPTGVDGIKEVIGLRLNPPAPSPVQALKTAEGDDSRRGVHKIYLICDTRDRKGGAWVLKQQVERAGMEVVLPETAGPDVQELRRDHLKKLKTSDGVVLYYHHAGKGWFEKNWRELNDLEAMRDQPWKVQALCLVRPPEKDAWVNKARDAGYAEASGAAAIARKIIVLGDQDVDPILRAMRGGDEHGRGGNGDGAAESVSRAAAVP